MNERDYISFDALGLADLVRNGQVSPRELVDVAIQRIERLNPTLNAVVHRMFDRARRDAEFARGDGIFAGVPYLFKDLMSSYAGEPLTGGSRLYRTYQPSFDSEVVTRVKKSGVLVLGKTNTPEFGLSPFTEPELFGKTCNPWNPERTAGGSSGGSGAAVGARLVPMASGGDGGGSLRIPASCNGVFAIKPTRGRVPTGPVEGDMWNGASIEHAITKSVRDSAAMLDVIAGADPGAPYAAAPPRRPFMHEMGQPVGRLRVGVLTAPLIGRDVHRDCLDAVADARALCESLGHETVEVTLPVIRNEFNTAFVTMICGEVAADLADTDERIGRPAARADVEVTTWALGTLGRAIPASALATARRRLQRISRRVGQAFEQFDVLLTPTVAAPPVLHGTLQPPPHKKKLLGVLGALGAGRAMRLMGAIDQAADKIFDWIPYTPLFNVTGQPAMSVPLYWNAESLPIGVQFVGRAEREDLLFRLASQLEQARPWADRIPPLAVPRG